MQVSGTMIDPRCSLSQVLLVQASHCSLCIYLGVVQRLHAAEIKIKRDRTQRDDCILELSGFRYIEAHVSSAGHMQALKFQK